MGNFHFFLNFCEEVREWVRQKTALKRSLFWMYQLESRPSVPLV